MTQNNTAFDIYKVFHMICHYAPILVMIFDQTGKCFLWNAECQKNLMWSASDIRERNDFLSVLFPEEHLKKQIWHNAWVTPGKYHTYPVMTKDGNSKSQSWANFLMEEELIFCIGYDIDQKNNTLYSPVEFEREFRFDSFLLEQAKDEERKRISREIHDEFGQILSLIKQNMADLNTELSEMNSPQIEKVTGVVRMVDSLIEWVQKMASNTIPRILDEKGLLPALKWIVSNFETRGNLKCTFRSNVSENKMNKMITNTVFWIFQEAFTNIYQHAQASYVEAELQKINNDLVMIISDDGVGIDDEIIKEFRTEGLIGMKERVKILNGIFTIESMVGKGTTLTVRIPLNSEEL